MLDFEKPILEMDRKIKDLRVCSTSDCNILEEIRKLEEKKAQLIAKIYSNLSPQEKVLVARHKDRPHTSDYISAMIEDFVPLAGDRCFAEDTAILAGIGVMNGFSVAILGHEKGRDTESKVKHNFGMPHPEGYRKSKRIIELANRFHMPIITLIDTAGAYPGVGAEERGQAEAIAQSISACLDSEQPIISVIIGEGGSGGAVALAASDRILMLQHSIYSVISPEGCASILWRHAEKAKEAAAALKLTSTDLKKYGIIDEIIQEPIAGAHSNPAETIASVQEAIQRHLTELLQISDHKTRRLARFRQYGAATTA